jgi:hypothetical protein
MLSDLGTLSPVPLPLEEGSKGFDEGEGDEI